MNAQLELVTEETVAFGDLVTVETKNVAALFLKNGLDPIIEKLREEVAAFVPDISTKKGREEIKSFAYKIAQSKNALDKAGKNLVADMKSQVKAVDEERSRAWDAIEQMQHDVRKPLTDWENADKERIEKLERSLAEMAETGNQATTSDAYAAALVILEEYQSHDWQEFSERAKKAYTDRHAYLSNQRDLTKKAEEDAAELERLRRAEEERKQKERDEQLQREAAEKARKEAEDKAAEEQRKRDEEARIAKEKIEEEKRLAEKKAEAERIAKEAAEKQAADEKARAEKAEADALVAAQKAADDRIAAALKAEREQKEAVERAAEAERARIAAEQKALADAEAAREADKAHRRKIMQLAFTALQNHVHAEPDLDAEGIIKLIDSGQIPNVKIHY